MINRETVNNAIRFIGTQRIHIGNASWATVEYLAYPLLMILATPLLVSRLGIEQYGLWVLVNSFAGMSGVSNLGMGTAVMKFVSARRGQGNNVEAARSVQICLAMSLAGGALFSGLLALLTPYLAREVFQQMGPVNKTIIALYCAAVLVLLFQLDNLYSQTIKASERFDIAAYIEISCRFVLLFSSVAAACIFRNIIAVLLITIIVMLISVICKGLIASNILCASLFLPYWSKKTAREVFRFGFWSWTQGIAGVLFQQADRIILGAVLGSTVLAHYNVCLQLVRQIHSVPSAAMSIIFPLVSRKKEECLPGALRFIRDTSLLVNYLSTLFLAGLLFFAGHKILILWMGKAFASEAGYLLPWMILPFFLLSLCIVPTYFLLGCGEVRFVSSNSILAGLLGLVAAIFLVPGYGAIGAALSRVVYALAALLAYFKLYKLGRGSAPF